MLTPAARTFWLLWIVLVWTWVCKSLFRILLSGLPQVEFCSDKDPEVGMLGCTVVTALIVGGTLLTVLHSGCTTPTSAARGSSFSPSSPALVFSFSFCSCGTAVLVGVALMHVHLMTSDAAHVSIRCWLAFVYLIWGNVCSSLLPIFKISLILSWDEQNF